MESLPVRRRPLPSLPCPTAGAAGEEGDLPGCPSGGGVISAAPSLADLSPRCLYLMRTSRTAHGASAQLSGLCGLK